MGSCRSYGQRFGRAVDVCSDDLCQPVGLYEGDHSNAADEDEGEVLAVGHFLTCAKAVTISGKRQHTIDTGIHQTLKFSKICLTISAMTI